MNDLHPDAPRQALPGDAPAAAALHAAGIPEAFLVSLGPRFLTRLYARIIRSSRSFVLVTDDGRGVSGFIAIAEDTGRLYREFVLHDGVVAAGLAAPWILRRPRHVWETLRYGAVPDAELPPAEILAVAVAPRAQGRGIGTALLRAGVAELARRSVPAARVVTASGNLAALRMYGQVGFEHVARTEVHRGVSQDVLVWR